jgi:hypothetical protein
MLEPLWIPIILYLLAIIFAAIVFGYLRIRKSAPGEEIIE